MIYAGDQNVKRCFLGDTFIKKIYQGDTLVFEHKSRLPEGYTELAYISNPDGAGIYNFSVGATDIWRNRFEFGLKLLDESKTQFFFGGSYRYYYKRTSGTTSRGCWNVLYYNYSSTGSTISLKFGYHGTNPAGTSPQSILYTNPQMDIVVDIPKHLFSVNGEAATLPNYTDTSNSQTPSLFAKNSYSYSNDATSSSSSPYTYRNYVDVPANIQFYYLKVYNSTAESTGELVHHYVPAKTDTGKVGVFDLISEKFYSNYEANHVFVAGPNA